MQLIQGLLKMDKRSQPPRMHQRKIQLPQLKHRRLIRHNHQLPPKHKQQLLPRNKHKPLPRHKQQQQQLQRHKHKLLLRIQSVIITKVLTSPSPLPRLLRSHQFTRRQLPQHIVVVRENKFKFHYIKYSMYTPYSLVRFHFVYSSV